ncbi:MYND-type zinc finger-containing chromatin reader ZMYND8 isoform X14 [Mustela lutreola]|uniref:MYND-type zinc finger-containing chromatin reader ZMYND8 isoform X14 n=1 Tax=Mustela lutreola TaxID=9666 RepID=UPI002797C1C5|nr:MYND-type zinc finger-containing chromatin reader ZMYND8 isoform X14 [Mustela lutreola]
MEKRPLVRLRSRDQAGTGHRGSAPKLVPWREHRKADLGSRPSTWRERERKGDGKSTQELHPLTTSWRLCLAEEEIKTEQEVVEGMDISTRSKDPGSTERTAQKRKFPSPPHSSNGHSPQDTSTSPIKKKKKPGLLNNNNKEQSELRHGPFYYMKQPLTTDPVDVVPQDGRNDFYCWVCHREGQVLCCELCPRVYHAKCLRLTSEPEGDWFCPECEKITVAECIETQSKAMTMLTIEQLSYLLKFAIQKMKQPGTDAFQKPVPLEQHPDYAEYIFHPMDLCTLEKNAKKKMYGCTEAFLADAKWILHNCIIYNGGNHKLTQIAKVVIKICEHEMNEIEVCPECYLAACQKRDNWFCEPCSNPHPLVWAKLKGFPFWPAKALRDKDGQVDARFFGQHDRAWVPINNCYLMSKEIPFSVKKTKSIFNSAMQEMEVYVENIRRKFGVFNYSPFRTPYTPNSQYQMLLDPSNPSAGAAKIDKQEKVKLNFDMTASPKILMSKPMLSGGAGRRISLSDMPRSPMSTNSSVHTGSDVEQDAEKKATSSHFSASEESMDFLDKSTASPASAKTGQAGSLSGSPKTFSPQASTPITTKTDKTSSTGSILNLNLDRSKAEMDLKELSESVQQQTAPVPLISPKRQIRSRFQLNLDKTIESCKAQLVVGKAPPSTTAGSQSPPETPLLTRSSSQTPTAGVTVTTSTTSTVTAPATTATAAAAATTAAAAAATATATATTTGSPVKKQRPLLPKETAPAVQRVAWNSSTVQQKEITQSPSTATITLVTSTQSSPLVTSSGSTSTLASSVSADLPIATASADVAADIAKYTSKMMDAIKGTMTEIYNDLSKNTTGSTIAEIRRLRIEIEKLQWLHQQELSEMKHNLELTMAEMRQSLEQERDRLMAEVKKQLELEKQQAVDETKKKQWCANCKKEAIFYCCWNTSYCDYPCQQAHWPEHMKSCTQSATAPQQEADAEVNSETLNKPSQGSSSSTQAAPTETASTSKEKEAPAEKSKDSGSTIPGAASPVAGAAGMRSEEPHAPSTTPAPARRASSRKSLGWTPSGTRDKSRHKPPTPWRKKKPDTRAIGSSKET